MIVLTVALGASVATSMLSVMFDVGDKINQELKAYGANITVKPKGAAVVQDLYHFKQTQDQGAYLAEDELINLKSIFWTYNIIDFAPLLHTEADLSVNGTTHEAAEVVGTWFNHEIVPPAQDPLITGLGHLRGWWTISGQWPSDDDPQAV
ncbi:MAG: ABC transporter permease, partial [Bowdeniella nasicola]|nr:ABC transporter permease [Bowdeniella nasicola]